VSASPAAAQALAVYVHLPWCVQKCPYCDFNSHAAGPEGGQHDSYLSALEADLDAEGDAVAGRAVQTVFLGGGTPSLFTPADIDRLLNAITARVTLAEDAEITMEANPGTLERGKLHGYRDAGVNRLSLGAQSFNDRALKKLGRLHGRTEIVTALAEARDAGFDNVNLDLMVGLPGQDLQQALADIDAALALDVEHVSHYQLTLEPNTVFHAHPPADLPDDDLAFDMQSACHERLAAAGFERYEVSAFARPGNECRHNLNYWRFGDYLGVGAGAHGKLTDREGHVWRSEKTSHPREYMQRWANGTMPVRRFRPDADDLLFEYMLNVLRLPAGFDAASFEAGTGQKIGRLLPYLAGACERGLLASAGEGRWRPTALGFRFLNDLQAVFLPPAAR